MDREKFYANEKKEQIYYSRGAECEVCKAFIPFNQAQLAHRISKSKANIKKYGKDFIHSDINIALVCSAKCNDAVNVGFKPMEVQRLLDEYKKSH